jgi:hypothetical protein
MNVSYMSDGVREFQRVAFSAADGGGFFIQRQGQVAVSRISFDLAQRFEGHYQLAARPALATERDSRSQTIAGIVWSILPACSPGLVYKSVEFLRHSLLLPFPHRSH